MTQQNADACERLLRDTLTKLVDADYFLGNTTGRAAAEIRTAITESLIHIRHAVSCTKDLPVEERIMTPKEASEILDEFNAWRRGIGKYGWKEQPEEYLVCPYNPGQIGDAIDVAVKYIREKEKDNGPH